MFLFLPQVVSKDLIIQDKERLYVELKNILARQPGPEVAEQLEIYGVNLKNKKRQMKAMKSELLMYKQQVVEYRNDLEQVSSSFDLLQGKYFKMLRHQKRVEQQQQQQQQQEEGDFSYGYPGDNNNNDSRNTYYGGERDQSVVSGTLGEMYLIQGKR